MKGKRSVNFHKLANSSFFPFAFPFCVHECNLLAPTMWVFDEQSIQGKVEDYPVNQAVRGRSTSRNFGQGYTSGLSLDIILCPLVMFLIGTMST